MAAQEQNTRFPQPKEMVGSADLREVFKEHGRVRGNFFINGIEMHQLEANSPASLVSQINAKQSGHFVTAEIDDGGHLVLIDHSGADIMVREGSPYADPPPTSTGDAARDALLALKGEAERQNRHGGREKPKGITEMLGLEANDKSQEAGGPNVQPGFETGASAEDRKKRHEENIQRQMGIQAFPARQASGPGGMVGSGRTSESPQVQIPSNPTPGNQSSDGKLDDGRGRTGTGGGQGETAGATVQNIHSNPGAQSPVPGA